MGRRFGLARQPGRWVVPTVGLAGLAAVATWLAMAGEAPLHYTDVPRIELPLPPAVSPHGPPRRDPPQDARTAPGNAPIDAVPADPALLDEGPFGPLPRIAPDGRRPFLVYARPFDLEDRRPKIAILVLGLGLQRELLNAALTLPAPVGLQFSPYAHDLAASVDRARRAGHEVLLELPMEPADYPASDPGPQTLLAGADRAENLRRLNWLLSRATGYIALAGGGARFAASDQAATILDVLARRGLALIELGGNRLASAAAAAGLPYASAQDAIDRDPSALAIDHALAALEAEALARGSALGVAQGYPVSLERLRLWAATLEANGLVLAPVSAVLIEQAGLAGDLPTDDQRAASRPES